MAQKSINIKLYDESDLDALANVLDGVVENVQTGAVSEAIKNRFGSGDPKAGSVEYRRFVNATLKAKGTARAATKGDKVEAEPIIIPLSDHKEIVEELAVFDVHAYGIPALAEKRLRNFAQRVIAYLDTQFFAKAGAVGTKVARGGLTDPVEIIDQLIVEAKTISGDFIDGIDAQDLALVLTPVFRKALKTHMDALPQGTVAQNGLVGQYDGVDVHETHRLPENINAIIMLKGAVAQPYWLSEYGVEKIPLDDAVALQNFLYSGRDALNPEAILYDGPTFSA